MESELSMKYVIVLAACLGLCACGIHIETDEKSGDIKSVHISIADFGNKQGNGESKTETRQVGAIKTVEATGPMDVEVSIGSTPGLSVEADANLLADIETVQQGDRLIIRTRKSFKSDHAPVVRLVTPSLLAIQNTGSGDVSVGGLDGGELSLDSTGSGDTRLRGKLAVLNVHLVGSGDLEAGELTPGKVTIDVLGSGDAKFGQVSTDQFSAAVKGSGSVTASGSTKALTGNVLGSGDLNLADLHADSADIELLGSGDVSVFASQSVRVHAMGSGDVKVHGKPAKQDIHGEHVSIE
jgi:hypothetical protein